VKKQRKNSFRRISRRDRRIWPKGLVVLVLLIVLAVFVHGRLRPVVEDMAAYQAKVYAAKVTNKAMLEELEQSGIAYDDLVLITQNQDGLVTSIQSDVVAINRLKANMTQSIITELENMGQQSIYLPLGTLIGNEWFSGRGPSVEIRVIPSGYVQSEIYNSFISAGINQTHHQVMLRTTVQMVAVLPGYNIKVESTTNFCVAETVIIGTIPDTVIQFGGDDAPVIAKIGDDTPYAA